MSLIKRIENIATPYRMDTHKHVIPILTEHPQILIHRSTLCTDALFWFLVFFHSWQRVKFRIVVSLFAKEQYRNASFEPLGKNRLRLIRRYDAWLSQDVRACFRRWKWRRRHSCDRNRQPINQAARPQPGTWPGRQTTHCPTRPSGGAW
jgi:hypothetical protein